MMSTQEHAGAASTTRRLVMLVALGHFGWALRIAATHPGLAWEPDRVANRLYLSGLLTGTPRLAEFWYFPAPKILGVLLSAPLVGETGEALLAALAAAILAGSTSWILARSFGPLAGLGLGAVLALDPWWTSLVATASGDLHLAAGVTAAIAAWEADRPRLATAFVLLSTLAKTPGAVVILPMLVDGRRSFTARAWPLAAVFAGLLATLVGYAALLGDSAVPFRFLRAYTEMSGAPAPTVVPWIAHWLGYEVFGGMLGWCWPLGVVGLVATFREAQAGPMRRWLAASVGVAAGFAVLAALTATLLFPRFLWSLELVSVALCVAGAVVAGRFLGRRVADSRSAGWLAAGFGVAGCVLVGASLARLEGQAKHYEVLFEYGARTAVPWLEQMRDRVAPGERILVPDWFQPAAMSILPGSRVEAAEVLIANPPSDHLPPPEWILLAPAYVDPHTARWLVEQARTGEVVASSDLPRMSLLRLARPPTSVD